MLFGDRNETLRNTGSSLLHGEIQERKGRRGVWKLVVYMWLHSIWKPPEAVMKPCLVVCLRFLPLCGFTLTSMNRQCSQLYSLWGGFSETWQDDRGWRGKRESGFPGRVWQTSSPLHVCSLTLLQEKRAKAKLVTPVFVCKQTETLGVLLCDKYWW